MNCRAGDQDTRFCVVLSFLEVLFSSRKDAFIFCWTRYSCHLCSPGHWLWAAYKYHLACAPSTAVLVSQVLLVEITGLMVQLLWVFGYLNRSALLLHWSKIQKKPWWGVPLSWPKRSYLREEHLTSLNFHLLDGRGEKLHNYILLYTTGSMPVFTVLWPNWWP